HRLRPPGQLDRVHAERAGRVHVRRLVRRRLAEHEERRRHGLPDPTGAEAVTVRQIPTRISTSQKVFPQDSATIESTASGETLPAAGTVTFRLYGPTSGATGLQNCQAHGDTVGQGGLLYREVKDNVDGSDTVTVGTSNTTASVNDSVTVYWRVTY